MATLLPVPDSLQRLRDDLMEWNVNNLKVRVPNTRTINNKALDKDIVLNYEDVGADKAGSAQTAKDEAISIANRNASEAISTALTNANSYTDQQINQEVINRNNAISTEVNNLNNTINQAIATEAKDRNSAIATAKQEAINTANQNTTTLVNNVKTELKEYTDNIVQEEVGSVIDDSVTTYTETWSSKKISGMITDAKTYAETKANDVLTAAKSYTNSEISKEVTNRNSAIATAKKEAIDTAASDATNKANKALSDAKSYTNSEISKEVTNRNSAIATAKQEAINTAASDAKSKADAALESAKTYTNNQVSNVKVEVNNYTDTKATQILQEAKTYTDTSGATEVKGMIGTLSSLKTSAKDNLVNAINEVFQLGSNVKTNIVAALEHSNLGITKDSTWDEIYAALRTKFPQYTTKTVTPNYTKTPDDNHALDAELCVLLYGPIDASAYKSVTIDIVSCWVEANFEGSTAFIGFGSWNYSTPPTKYSAFTSTTYIAEGSRAWVDPDGEGEQEFNQYGTRFTHTFAEESGNVYLFMGCVGMDGSTSGYQDIKIKSPITLNPR